MATDGSLLGTAGKWRACGWAVVQLDYDEEMWPLHGMYGSMEAEYEVQRTIKRAEGEKEWEELHELVKRGILVEVEHVKAHRTKKEKEKMTQLERFATKGNEKADELAKVGAMLDEGYMADARVETMKQERERR